MFGQSISELANLVTVRSYTQFVFSVCVIVGMFWPMTRAKVLWSLALVTTFFAVISLSATLSSAQPGWTTMYGIATSISVSLYHAALIDFSEKPIRYRLLVAPPLLSLALGILAYWVTDIAMLAIYMISAIQLVVLAIAAARVAPNRSRLGGRLLLCVGSLAAAVVTIFQAGLNFISNEHFIFAYGVMALGTAMAMIMQNMGWLALQKDSAEIQLERLAHVDGLTGVLNRRGLARHASLLVRSAQRGGRPLSVLLLDIDHFKSINDNWGHDEGDRVLAALGILLLQQVRGKDICARLGGEEFLLVLSDCDPANAFRIGEQLRDTISDQLRLPNGAPVRFSGGIAQLEFGETSLDQAIGRADRALYEAKAGGRDCLVRSSAEPALMAA